MDKIKVGIKINLEMKPTVITNNMINRRILKMNFYQVDNIKTLDYINNVVVYDDSISYINLIIKFCKITKLPLKLYLKNDLSDKIINKLDKYKIKYIIYK